MKSFRRFIVFLIIIEALIIGIVNVVYYNNSKNNSPQIAREEENGKTVYRVTYNNRTNDFYLVLMNSALGAMTAISLFSCIYINRKIIKPFSTIKELPYELAKGNLNIPLKEQKNKYFGKFTWGMNMLRENLEDNKKRELS